MKNKFLFFIVLIVISGSVCAQQEIKLYPNGPKEKNGFTEEKWTRTDFLTQIFEPRMYYYPAIKDANGTAVLICPGGGYSGVSVENEGKKVAEWFNKLGVAAFVLYYRMPNGHYKVPETDAFTALKIIHKNAPKWNIDENKIGIMGFSAGGHLASTVGTHFKNKIQRPAFMILGYPVITMNKITTHGGSRNNLLGKNPSEKLIKSYSNEMRVTKNTPPTFLVYALDDKAVPPVNSESFYQALLDHNVSAEINKYEIGGHGFGMRKQGIPADNWTELLKNWLEKQNLIK